MADLDFETERDLIAALLADPGGYWRTADIVSPTDFSDVGAGSVFITIREMLADGTPVEVGTVRDRMRDTGRIPQGTEANERMLRFVYDRRFSRSLGSGDLASYATTVHIQALRRRLRAELHAAVESIATRDPVEVIASLTSSLGALVQPLTRSQVVTIETAALAAIDARENPDQAFLTTGYGDLDAGIRGLRRGELVVIAGRPYVGKTTFTLGLAYRMAAVAGTRTYFVSLEMAAEALGETAFLFSTGIPGSDFAAAPDLSYMRRLATEKLGGIPIEVERRYRLTAEDVPALLRRARAQHGADVVVIDNLHLMEQEGARRNGNRVQELAAITRTLKNGAAETGLVVIAISHLNRAADLRDDHRPVLADLRDSGTIEQDADVVAFLHRADYYQTARPGQKPPVSVAADLIIRKRRGGAPTTIPFYFFPGDCSFRPASTLRSEAG